MTVSNETSAGEGIRSTTQELPHNLDESLRILERDVMITGRSGFS
jgi:hypothetical protein